MNTLLIEIIACLFAAAFLSLFIGWAIRSSLATREVESVNESWQTKYADLEMRSKQDSEQLEDQLQQLKSEAADLSNRNDNINESLRENEISIHKARADAIELNRQQADTQERLQRIIAQKDEELKRIRAAGTAGMAGATGAAGLMAANADETEAKMAALSAKREAWESERARLVGGVNEDQATIAIDPADLPTDIYSDQLDQTVRIDAEQLAHLKNRSRSDSTRTESTPSESTTLEEESDKTMTLDQDQDETMLLDSVQRRPTPGGTPEDNDS